MFNIFDLFCEILIRLIYVVYFDFYWDIYDYNLFEVVNRSICIEVLVDLR